MGCFLFGLPLGVISIMCYGIYTADTDGGYIEERYEVSKSEMENQEQIEESKEQESSSGGSLVPTVQGPKDVLEKKKDWEFTDKKYLIEFQVIKEYLLNLEI